MNVLTDYHHGQLYGSLHLLLEKRLGYNLFRPIGEDWFENGFWKIAEPYGNAQDTINQYLGINDRSWDTFTNLNGNYKLEDDIYHIYDPENQLQHKAITFEKFKQMKFDYIIATYPHHENWEQLLQYQPRAKFIAQLGNIGQTTNAQNVLCSTSEFTPQPHQKVYQYHQEFKVSPYEPPKNHNKITSFVIGLPERELFELYKSQLPEFEMKAYGQGAIDGVISGEKVAEEMRNSAFGWHVKPGGDGYGHVIHGWLANGRPVIVKSSYYKGKMAESLLIDNVTCIDLDKHSFDENVALIRKFSQPEEHKKMCENVIRNFHDVVNFDREAQEVKDWLAII